jgi:hypothetical protein
MPGTHPRFSLSCFALFLLLAAASAVAQQTNPDFTELEKIALAELAETNTPKAAIGIVRGDQLIFARGFGVSNVETGAPVTPESGRDRSEGWQALVQGNGPRGRDQQNRRDALCDGRPAALGIRAGGECRRPRRIFASGRAHAQSNRALSVGGQT